MEKKKPVQAVIPQNVVQAYNALKTAEKEGKICMQYGGRSYGKAMLHGLLTNVN